MVNNRFNKAIQSPRWLTASALCVVLAASAGGARSADNSVITEQTESFLSDRSSVGALVGGILAGASFATPFAPLGGTIVGFFVGKSTDFSDQDDRAGSGYASRSFAPTTASTGIEALALSGDNSSDETGALVFASEADPADEVMVAELNSAPGGELEPATNQELEAASGGGSAPDGGEGAMAAADDAEPAHEPVHEPVHLVITKQVGREQEQLDELAETIRQEQNRPEFEPSQRCPEREAPRYRKKLAVAGFAVEYPEQTVFGDLSEAGQSVSKMLYQQFQQSGKVLPYASPNWQMFASLDSAPTHRGFTNELSKYSAVSREMGAQFVVSGVIRSVALHDQSAWDTSTYAKAKRTVFGADTLRSFVVDVVVHDGYTGQVMLEKRFETAGAWEAGRYEKVGFGSSRFADTEYGRAVNELLADISGEVAERVACQPMLVPILEVNGQDMVLDVGTDSGLLPGDKLRVVRAQSSWADLNAPPRLIDTGVKVHIHSLSLDSAQAWMPEHGGMINIQQGDYAVIH